MSAPALEFVSLADTHHLINEVTVSALPPQGGGQAAGADCGEGLISGYLMPSPHRKREP